MVGHRVYRILFQSGYRIGGFLTSRLSPRPRPVCTNNHLSLTAQDITITSIEDGHDGAAIELTASGTEFDLRESG